MKTLKNTGITLMLALIASTATLAQNPTLKLAEDEQIATVQTSSTDSPTFDTSLYQVKQTAKMQLSMEKQAGERVNVRLLTEDGKVLYSEWVGRSTKKYACRFDFTKVKDGTYTIEVANGSEVKRKTISLSTPAAVQAPGRNLIAVN
ncbi:hypothetical protein [Persicitalea sp.]|uniref:hypothetical protein n=1 Tax=Persicitalea sp. TaxID=3100273 RepID=UPI003593B03C